MDYMDMPLRDAIEDARAERMQEGIDQLTPAERHEVRTRVPRRVFTPRGGIPAADFLLAGQGDDDDRCF